MSQKNLKENVESRALDANSIFFASFLAGLNTYGILNQAVVNKAAERAGAYLARFALLQGPPTSVPDKFSEAVNVLKKTLFISSGVEAKEGDSTIAVAIESSTCRFCPKGVGEADLDGTLCPFPALMKAFCNEYWGVDVVDIHKERSKPIMFKEDGWCVFEYDRK